jgi:hypothetical protein
MTPTSSASGSPSSVAARASAIRPRWASTSARRVNANGRSSSWPVCAIVSKHSSAYRAASCQFPARHSTRPRWNATYVSECSSPRASAPSRSASSVPRAASRSPAHSRSIPWIQTGRPRNRSPLLFAVELDRSLDQRRRDALAAHRLEERHVGERARKQRRFAQLLCKLECGGGVRDGARHIAGLVHAPREPALDLDAQRGIVADFLECGVEEACADVEAFDEGPQPGEPRQRRRALFARR